MNCARRLVTYFTEPPVNLPRPYSILSRFAWHPTLALRLPSKVVPSPRFKCSGHLTLHCSRLMSTSNRFLESGGPVKSQSSATLIMGSVTHLNVMRTVTELQKAGVAALTLEDTHLPAKYDEQSNVLIERQEAAAKIYAARFARSDDALSIIARTNVAATTLEDSIARTTAYPEGRSQMRFAWLALRISSTWKHSRHTSACQSC